MKWFKHMTNMRHDPKIRRLIRVYSAEGYAVYNYILESIAGNLDNKTPNPKLEETVEDIAYELKIDAERVEDIVSFCVEENLFNQDKAGVVLCYKLYKFLDDTTRKSAAVNSLLKAAAENGYIQSGELVRENPADSESTGKTPSNSTKVLQDTDTDTDTDTDIDTDIEGDVKRLTNASRSQTNGLHVQCPHSEIIKIWHEILPELPRIEVWGKNSQTYLRALWKSHKIYQNIEWWRNFFINISESDFLRGHKTEFQATLGWVVQPKNFEKIINGNYKNRSPKTNSRITNNNIQAAKGFLNEQ